MHDLCVTILNICDYALTDHQVEIKGVRDSAGDEPKTPQLDLKYATECNPDDTKVLGYNAWAVI